MGAQFTNSSSMRVSNSSPGVPTTGYPWTCGGWFFITTLSASRFIFGLSNPSSTNNNPTFQGLFVNGSTQLTCISDAAGSGQTAISTLAPAAGSWSFAICRFGSATNRWISHLNAAGATSHVQSTTSNAPTSMTTMNISGEGITNSTRFLDGIVGEFWYCDADIGAALGVSAAALDDAVFRKLAYEGPFSIPQLADDIVEYKSLFSSIDSAHEGIYDNYSRIGRTTWTVSATPPIVGPHPPLSPNYIRPGQTSRILMV